jgi:DNA-binding Lrp family transcriptional regulator
MDDLDQHLLGKLRENARAPVAELARSLGLSRTTVQSRLARLERTGVIAGYAVKLARTEQGALVRAHLMLAVEARQAAAITQALRRLPAVLRLQSVSGPFDMIAELEGQGMEDLDATIAEIAALPGVERASASVVLATRFDR